MQNFKTIFFLFTLYSIVTGCFQEKFDKEVVLQDLSEYYYANKVSFDTLTAYTTDSTKDKQLLGSITKILKFKKNEKGYGKPFYSDSGNVNYSPSWNLKEYGYSIQCGLFFNAKEKLNSFENSRMTYKRIEGSWFSYIYFN